MRNLLEAARNSKTAIDLVTGFETVYSGESLQFVLIVVYILALFKYSFLLSIHMFKNPLALQPRLKHSKVLNVYANFPLQS